MQTLKPLGLAINIASANTVNDAKTIYISNISATNQLVTVANTTANTSSFYIPQNSGMVLIKNSSDTVQAANTFATPVSYTY